MISDRSAKYLSDARQAAARNARFTHERDFDAYMKDEMLRSAVERQFEIIGEALGSLRRLDPELGATIPDLARFVAFRNVLIHQYAGVDDRLVWGVVEGSLAALLLRLDELLGTAI